MSSTKKLHVKVEDYHIKCGVPGTGGFCPIALAVTPLLPAGQTAVVTRICVAVWSGQQILDTYDLPNEASRFTMDFDSGKQVSPFEFDLTSG